MYIFPVPGDGGSQFVAQLNKTESVHFYCSKKSSTWFSLWLNIELMVPLVLDCFVDNMRWDNKLDVLSTLFIFFFNCYCSGITQILLSIPSFIISRIALFIATCLVIYVELFKFITILVSVAHNERFLEVKWEDFVITTIYCF